MIEFILNNAAIRDTQDEVINVLRNSDQPLGFCWNDQGDLFKVTKSQLLITTSKVPNTTLAGNDAKPVKEGAELLLPKIPLNHLLQIVTFFKDICNESGNEVFARIYFDKETEEYLVYVPTQKISKCNVTYNIDDERFQNESRFLFVLDIHSHNTMGAFFSSTDNKDEQSDGKIFMVVGNLDKEVAYKLRTFQAPNHVELDFFSIFERPEGTIIDTTTPYGTFHYEVPEDEIIKAILASTCEYPEDWKNQITQEISYPSSWGGSSCYGFGSSYHDISSKKYGSKPSYSSGQLTLFGDEDSYIEDEHDAFFPKSIVSHIPQDEAEETFDFDEEAVDTKTLTTEEKYLFASQLAEEIVDLIDSRVENEDSEFTAILGECLRDNGKDLK